MNIFTEHRNSLNLLAVLMKMVEKGGSYEKWNWEWLLILVNPGAEGTGLWKQAMISLLGLLNLKWPNSLLLILTECQELYEAQ